jgi:hypothetical protein
VRHYQHPTKNEAMIEIRPCRDGNDREMVGSSEADIGAFGRAFPSASPLAFTEALPNP